MQKVGRYEIISDEVFERELLPTIKDESRHGYCPDCHLPMAQMTAEYQCDHCGLSQNNELGGYKDLSENVSGNIRMTTGGNKKIYNINGDYAEVQLSALLSQLRTKAQIYTGAPFAPRVIKKAAKIYNSIQRNYTEAIFDSEGNTIGQKKYVRRSDIKNEILAALIYFIGINEGLVRNRTDVTNFMGLSAGFSRGENAVRNLRAQKVIDLVIDELRPDGYIEKYLEALNIDRPNYRRFILDVYDRSESKKIGMSSQMSSKIVGIIWVIIQKCRLNITAKQLEISADKIKKSTFAKFSDEITGIHFKIFADLFATHSIPK